MVHVVYTDNTGKKGEREIDKIIAGHKTMIIRSAAGRKIPHSRVFAGETLCFMEKGSLKITAFATVTEVANYVKLTEDEICKVFADNAVALDLTEKQQERWHKKCICLVSFTDVKELQPARSYVAHNLYYRQEEKLAWTSIEKY